jgi:hypothetical protein
MGLAMKGKFQRIIVNTRNTHFLQTKANRKKTKVKAQIHNTSFTLANFSTCRRIYPNVSAVTILVVL